jgi:DNA recombination protein RmuC
VSDLAPIIEWFSQSIPLYFLVAGFAVLSLALFLTNRRKAKRITELEIVKAEHTQQLTHVGQIAHELKLKTNDQANQLSVLIAQSSELKASRDEKFLQLKQVENERSGLREMVDNEQRKISRLEAEGREKNAMLIAEHQKLAELKSQSEKQFDMQNQQLKSEFKVVSEEIIKNRQSMLAEQNREGIGALLKPLQDQIDGFQQRINQVHDESIKGNTQLKSDIENVMRMGIEMRDEASNLSSALKGNSQQRGAWGEAQLERTLELSGLIAQDHFEKQASFTDDDGRRKQTDYLIKLPGDKCIIIDSKVSLLAYERACSSDIDQADAHMLAHVAAVRAHINDLTTKEYNNLSDLHSPDFVLMFMPIEPAYIEAMKTDPELFAFGYNKNIILVSHTTLIPILRTVANLWTLDRSNKEARQLGERANDIFNSVATVSERLESLGKVLNTASGHYNKTVTALSGNQGLQGKVKRFTELSSKANKTMPELEHKHHEFDVAKLEAEGLGSDQDN